MLNSIRQIEAKREILAKLLPLKPEDARRLDKKIRLEFNFNSNHIEGNTLTYGETELLLFFGETKGNHSKREFDEMEAHDVAYNMIQEWAKEERPLTESDIKSLNEIILVKPFWKEAKTPDGQDTRRLIKVGTYKEHPNSVKLENGEIFEYASPVDTPILMQELLDWYRTEEEKKELHPVELAALLHYKFVRIHPFDDGNGRISRLLVNYVLLRHNLPPVIIKSPDKKSYLNALHQADVGELEAFIDYIAAQELWSQDLYIKAAKGESLDEPGDLDKKIVLLKQKLYNTNDEVKVEKSNESVRGSIEASIIPLFREIDKTITKMAVFFKNKKIVIEIKGLNSSGNQVNPIRTIDTILDVLEFMAINSIKFHFEMTDLRNKRHDDKLFFSLDIVVVFHQLAYEIMSSDEKIFCSKLYHDIISEEEKKEIAESIGQMIFEKVEIAINQDSKPRK